MKLLVCTSTFPAHEADEVPAFVQSQTVALKQLDPDVEILVHAPHNHYSRTSTSVEPHPAYREHRYHYFWPHRLELLVGRGILSALRRWPWLYLQIPFLVTAQAVSLLRLTHKFRPDLIYAHWFTPQAIVAAVIGKLTRTPFVFTTHASDVSVLSKVPGSRSLVDWVCREARAYTAVSTRTAAKLQQFFSESEWSERHEDKLTILPMGVDDVHFEQPKTDPELIQQSFGLDDRPILLFLGRLEQKKGVEFLVEAFSELPERLRQSVQLVIAGDGSLRSNLESLAAESSPGEITFTGYVTGSAKQALIAQASFVCLPSIVGDKGDSEGFPVVLMEALAAGKIVLGSDASGAELVLQHGHDGFLFRSRSVLDLRDKLVQAISLDETQAAAMAESACDLGASYRWSTLAPAYRELLGHASDIEI